jgi:hypothetical protein
LNEDPVRQAILTAVDLMPEKAFPLSGYGDIISWNPAMEEAWSLGQSLIVTNHRGTHVDLLVE